MSARRATGPTAPLRANPLGIHALVWVDHWDTASAELAVERSADHADA